jgi:galactitol-specific phosphotransferase system IIB component
VDTVSRFHRYQEKLKSIGKSIDLNVTTYPNLVDLQSALTDITFLEVKNNLDHDIVFEDDQIIVVCPYNIGSSLKYGHHKWCTSNESMFRTACGGGEGPNRWKEYAKESALYYCRFKKVPTGHLLEHAAIQIPFMGKGEWKLYDTLDSSHDLMATTKSVGDSFGSAPKASFMLAAVAVTKHLKTYPHTRLNLELTVRK